MFFVFFKTLFWCMILINLSCGSLSLSANCTPKFWHMDIVHPSKGNQADQHTKATLNLCVQTLFLSCFFKKDIRRTFSTNLHVNTFPHWNSKRSMKWRIYFDLFLKKFCMTGGGDGKRNRCLNISKKKKKNTHTKQRADSRY